jgi:4-amino-4-deoxy-L-arabinose transferase-like glycosyltransferase
MPRQVREGLLLILVAAVVFLPGLGATRLWDDDETYFAQVAREMYDRGDPIVPWFNQALFSHKPPFMYWMMMGAYCLFGVTEFAARVPSALFGIANVLLIWRLGRILYSPGVGFWAGIVLATSLNFVVLARAATCDTELIFFCTLPIYLFLRGTAAKRSAADGSGTELFWDQEHSQVEAAWKTWALVYATMGIAVMVKGPIGAVLPTGVLGLYLLFCRARPAVWSGSEGVGTDSTPQTNVEHPMNSAFDVPDTSSDFSLQSPRLEKFGLMAAFRDGLALAARAFAPAHVLRTVWSMRPLTALAAVLFVAGPWFVAVGIKTRGEFLTGFFGVHHFHRFTSGMDNHAGPIWYYLAAICVGFFPWIIFLSPSLSEVRRRFREREPSRPADILVGAWCVVWIGFFSLATTKFPHYVVPAYPALALWTAGFLDRWTRQADIYGRVARNAAWGTVAVAGLGIVIVLPFVEREFIPGERLLGLPGVPLLAGAAWCAFFTERRQITRALAGLTATAVVFLAAIFEVAAVQVDQHQNTVGFARTMHRLRPADNARVATFGYFRPGLVYYCDQPVELLADRSRAVGFLTANPGRGFLLTTEEEYGKLAPLLPAEFGVLEREPWFLKSGRMLVLVGSTAGSDVSRENERRVLSDNGQTSSRRRE